MSYTPAKQKGSFLRCKAIVRDMLSFRRFYVHALNVLCVCKRRVGDWKHDLKKTKKTQRRHPSFCGSGTVAGGSVQTCSRRLPRHGSQLQTQHSHVRCRANRAAELRAKIGRCLQKNPPPQKKIKQTKTLLQ